MDDQNKKYETLISKLQSSIPAVSDPGTLTYEVIRKISMNKPDSNKVINIFWLRSISTAAAIFLFGLFLFQTSEYAAVPKSYEHFKLLSLKIHNDNFCENPANAKQQSRKDLIAQYKCYLQKNSTENTISKQFPARIIQISKSSSFR